MVRPRVQALAAGDKWWPHYWSTYCIHDQHDECRLTCKICDAPCRCPCHEKVKSSVS